jgi:hypothetical protein
MSLVHQSVFHTQNTSHPGQLAILVELAFGTGLPFSTHYFSNIHLHLMAKISSNIYIAL